MPKYKVYYQRTEIEEAIIEANSYKEAEELADTNYSDYVWSYCDGSMTGEFLTDESEEIDDN